MRFSHRRPRPCRQALFPAVLAITLLAPPVADAQSFSIWDDATIPGIESSVGLGPIEVGIKFRSDADGYVTALRFYKGSLNTGTHFGSLWASDGTLLAQVTYTGETASGWQEQALDTPVPTTAGETYITSYHTTAGHYSFDSRFFSSSGVDSGPLRALVTGEDGLNGVYANGVTPTFPTSSYHAANYWVDLVFTDSLLDEQPPFVTTRSPAADAVDVPASSPLTVTFNEAIDEPTLVLELRDDLDQLVDAISTYDDSTRTVTLTPSSTLADSTTHIATVLSGLSDLAGNPLATDDAWSFTTAVPDATPPTVTARDPAPDAGVVSPGTNVSVTFDEPIDPGSLVFELLDDGGVPTSALLTYDAATYTATLDPDDFLIEDATYTPTLNAVDDLAGNSLTGPDSWSFTTSSSLFDCPCSVWDDTTIPGIESSIGTGPIELGMRFRASADGFITALRFYKGVDNIGTHIGSLWTNDGTLLGQTTFQNETATGWQQEALPTPVTIVADATYVVSYHCPNGHYAFDNGFFASSGVDSGPLRALANGEDGRNGVYRSASSPRLPTRTYNGSNYWVDAVFNTTLNDTLAPHITSRSPASAAVDVSMSTSIIVVFNEPIDFASLVLDLRDESSAIVPWTVTYDAPTRTATLVPDALLTEGHTYEVTTDGAEDLSGNVMVAPVVWAFTTITPDVSPPSITTLAPDVDAFNVPHPSNIVVTFDEAVDETTLVFELLDPASLPIDATVSYDASTFTVTLDPTLPLDATATYTANVGSATDLAGNAMAAPEVWSFTTASPEGSGGPILVVADSSNPFGRYLREILQNEGLNYFHVDDATNVDAAALSSYELVILGEFQLSPAQATMLSDWVDAGGRLICMRPDVQLASLLGLALTGDTLEDAYLLIDSSTYTGAGLVDETIQFHSTADLYDTDDATVLATLYSDDVTATSHPAVTWRSVGVNGGEAAAFAFDLARSIVYTRQGNPDWVGQDRDGRRPYTASDLFQGRPLIQGSGDGSGPPDWVDLEKIEIPQADEQQRLLARLMADMLADRIPLPRFWYFPSGHKAVVVMTGDDHASGGTTGRFDDYIAASDPGCSVDDWECIRGTSYVYPDTPMTDAQVAFYQSQGFEIAVHVEPRCANHGPSDTAACFSAQINSAQSTWPSIAPMVSNRNHAVAWKNWISMAQHELDHGIRFDTNYYHYPRLWIGYYPVGFMTGSGLPMRFADLDGTVLDIYQAHTHMNDEADQVYPFTIDTHLDRALGSKGYFGAFCCNIHTDLAQSATSDATIASAQARGVPVVTSRQMLTWLDGRNASTFSNLAWDGSLLTFSVTKAAGARNLRALVPLASAAGDVAQITLDGVPIAIDLETLKARDYVSFPAETGSYRATYAPDTTPPTISAVTTVVQPDLTTTITWTTDENANALVEFGVDPENLDQSVASSSFVTAQSLNLGGLSTGVTYYYRVVSADIANNVSVETNSVSTPMIFVVELPPPAIDCVQDLVATDFLSGATTDVLVSETVDGELILAPTAGDEFFGSSLPTGWTSIPWHDSSSATVSDGVLSVEETLVVSSTLRGPGRSLEFVATFNGSAYQHAGFGISLSEARWAIFSTGGGGQVWARTASPTVIDTPLGAGYLGAPRKYRVDWNAGSVDFYIDDALVASHNTTITTQMRPLASDYRAGVGTLDVDYMRMSDHAPSGTYESAIFDAGIPVTRGAATWTSDEPAATAIDVYVRLGDTAVPDASWTPYAPVATNGGSVGGTSRFLQYRIDLSTTDPAVTPTLHDITISCPPGPDTGSPVISALQAIPDVFGTETRITWSTDELADSHVDYGTDPNDLSLGETIASLTSSHSVDLLGLTTDTTYYYRVTSTDGNGNSTDAPDAAGPPNSFTTPVEPPAAPPAISSVSATPAVDGTSATVTWTTDIPSDSRVDFGADAGILDQSVADGVLVTSHSIVLTGLTPNTVHYYRVTSIGTESNSATETPPPAIPSSFTTPPEPDLTAPVISGLVATAGLDGITAGVSWNTDEAADSSIDYGTDPGALEPSLSDSALVLSHGFELTGLEPGTVYFYRVTSSDAVANSTTEPSPPTAPASFTTASLPGGACAQDTTLANFSAGTLTHLHISEAVNGEVTLDPALGAELSGTTLPAGWSSSTWSSGGNTTVDGGEAKIDGAFLKTDTFYSPGRSLEFVGAFDGSVYQHIGFGVTFFEATWAIFSTGGGGQVWARTASGSLTDTPLGASYMSGAHLFRIDWNVSSVDFYIDDALVASHATTITDNMRPAASDLYPGGGRLTLDWLRVSPYAASGSIESRIFDAGSSVAWERATWDSDEPAGTTLEVYARFGDSPVPDGTWTTFALVPASGAPLNDTSRYIQYRADLSTTDSGVTPVLREISFECPE